MQFCTQSKAWREGKIVITSPSYNNRLQIKGIYFHHIIKHHRCGKVTRSKLTLTCTWSTQSNIEFVEHSGRTRREKHWEKLRVSCTISILSPTSSAWTYCKKCLLKVYTCPYGKDTWVCTSSRRDHTAALQSSWSRHSKKTVTFADSRIPITCIQVSLCSPESSSRWTKFWFFVYVSHQLNSVGRSTATSQSWCLSLSLHWQKASFSLLRWGHIFYEIDSDQYW